ncbi:polysaccharide pyruvyl transferase family protein [Kocuria flava]|uniref:polysaccharide pyruvyl transferase family protein n=1 Tax=Kocuria flava TaxID=446860 RepID=UPI003F1B35DB
MKKVAKNNYPQIVVTNAVLSNTGDAAIYQGILKSLHQHTNTPIEQIVVMDADAKSVRPLYPDWNICQQLTAPSMTSRKYARFLERALRRLLCELLCLAPKKAPKIARILRAIGLPEISSSVRALFDADIVISSGGTYLVDHYNFGPRIAELKTADAMGARILLWTQSMGPFMDRKSKRRIKSLAKIDAHFFVRDEPSRVAIRRALSPTPRVHIVPDVAFALGNITAEINEIPQRAHLIISIREWHSPVGENNFQFGNYKTAIRTFAETMLDKSVYVTALSTCQGVESYKIDDSALAKVVFDELPVHIDDDHHTPDQLMDRLRNVDIVVTTRMHMAILALSLGKPVIAIAYEFKTLELFKNLGLNHCVCAIEDVTSTWLDEQTTNALIHPQKYALTITQRRELAEAAMMPGTYARIHSKRNSPTAKA